MLRGRFLVLLRIFFVVFFFFFSERVVEHKDLAKKKKRTMGKGTKIMIVGVINVVIYRFYLF